MIFAITNFNCSKFRTRTARALICNIPCINARKKKRLKWVDQRFAVLNKRWFWPFQREYLLKFRSGIGLFWVNLLQFLTFPISALCCAYDLHKWILRLLPGDTRSYVYGSRDNFWKNTLKESKKMTFKHTGRFIPDRLTQKWLSNTPDVSSPTDSKVAPNRPFLAL